jgi:NAD(P)-dependent dehydrogenase (short-subunit alcohol dehydrogenase family)
MDLNGKTVVLTGASAGIGAATALELSQAGCNLVLTSRRMEKLEALAASLPGPSALLAADIAEAGVSEQLLALAKERFGRADVVINNAAIYPSKPFEDYTVEEHQAVQRVNVDAGIVAVQAALPGMRAKGFGRIINVSSITLSGGWANLSPYVASKMALIGLTRAWAREFGPDGVTVNAIAPGAFPTDAEKIHPDPEAYNRMVLDAQSIKRRGTAHDIANAIAFFASDETGFVTGHTLHVNGGWTMN